MKRKKRLNKVKEQRIREITTQAKTVFLKKGYFATTMEEIAKLAGVSKGTVYQYFKNKDDLYISLMMAHFEEYAKMMKEYQDRFSITQYRSGRDVLAEFYQIYLTMYKYDPDALRIIQKYITEDDFLQIDKKTKERIFLLAREIRLISEGILSECVESSLLPKINVRQMEDVFTGLYLGIAQLENQKFRLSGKDHFADTLNLCLSLIADGLMKGVERGKINLYQNISDSGTKKDNT
jgi:AcrR family transcriptional regulator